MSDNTKPKVEAESVPSDKVEKIMDAFQYHNGFSIPSSWRDELRKEITAILTVAEPSVPSPSPEQLRPIDDVIKAIAEIVYYQISRTHPRPTPIEQIDAIATGIRSVCKAYAQPPSTMLERDAPAEKYPTLVV